MPFTHAAVRMIDGEIRSLRLPALHADIARAEDVAESGWLDDCGVFVVRHEISSAKLTLTGEIPIITIAPVL